MALDPVNDQQLGSTKPVDQSLSLPKLPAVKRINGEAVNLENRVNRKAEFPANWLEAGESPAIADELKSEAKVSQHQFQEIVELLGLCLDQSEPPEVVKQQQQLVPFENKPDFDRRPVFFEGSFNPLTEAHLAIILALRAIGAKRIIMAVLPYNPRKPRSDYESQAHRIEMLKIVAKHYDIPIAEKKSDEGLWICPSHKSFHFERYRTWVDPQRYILMGSDNFEHFRTSNMTWALVGSKLPVWSQLQKFNLLYEGLFKNRVLVPTISCVTHATDIRQGRMEPMEVIRDYIEKHGLYGRGITQ